MLDWHLVSWVKEPTLGQHWDLMCAPSQALSLWSPQASLHTSPSTQCNNATVKRARREGGNIVSNVTTCICCSKMLFKGQRRFLSIYGYILIYISIISPLCLLAFKSQSLGKMATALSLVWNRVHNLTNWLTCTERPFAKNNLYWCFYITFIVTAVVVDHYSSSGIYYIMLQTPPN